MLTEAEKKWLEERSHDSIRECRKCGYMGEQGCLFVPPLYREWCCLEHENQDWIDCAEFEARVAARLTSRHDIDRLTACDGTLRTCHSAYLTCRACRLKHARLAVEVEMEKERK